MVWKKEYADNRKKKQEKAKAEKLAQEEEKKRLKRLATRQRRAQAQAKAMASTTPPNTTQEDRPQPDQAAFNTPTTGTSKEDVEFLKILTQSKTATQKELQAHAPQLVAAMAQQGAAIATAIGEQTWLALKEEAECVNKGMDAMILAKTEEIKAHTAP